MSLASTSFVARRVLGSRRWGTVLVIAVIAIAAGATMATVAGGRRAATSFDRFVRWSGGADVSISSLGLQDAEQTDAAIASLSALPFVEETARVHAFGLHVTVELDGVVQLPFTLFPFHADLTDPAFGRVKVVDGRLPDSTALSDAAVSFATAARFDLDVGDRIVLGTSNGPASVEIVGLIALPADFPTPTVPSVAYLLLTPAFGAAHPDDLDPVSDGIDVRLRAGAADVPALLQVIDAEGIPASYEVIGDRADGVRRLVRLQAGLMWIVSAVLGGAGLLVVGQLVRRDSAASVRAVAIAAALGLGRRQVVLAGAARGAACAALGGALAIGIAIATSPLFPLGVARIAEPSRGVDIDVVVLALGWITTVAVVALVGAVATALATRPVRRRVARVDRRRISTTLSPVVSTGDRLASRSLRAASGGSPFAGVLGLTSLLTLLVGAVVVRSDFERLVHDDQLSGGTWDITTQFNEETFRGAGPFFESAPGVAAAARGNWVHVRVNGARVYAAFVEPGKGIEIAMAKGRAPVGPDEIALGPAVMDELDVGIGDTVELQVEIGYTPEELSAPFEATVTGQPVLVSPLYEVVGDGGAAVSLDLPVRAGYPFADLFWIVRMDDDHDDRESIQQIGIDAGPDYWFATAEPSSVGALRDLRSLPLALVVVLGVFAVVTLAQRLLVGSRANRRHLAIVRALGFSNRQLLASGALHGIVVSLIAVVAGTLIGVAVARPVWRWVADYLRVVLVHVLPGPSLAIVATAALLAAVVAGVLVADRVRRRPATESLRVE